MYRMLSIVPYGNGNRHVALVAAPVHSYVRRVLVLIFRKMLMVATADVYAVGMLVDFRFSPNIHQAIILALRKPLAGDNGFYINFLICPNDSAYMAVPDVDVAQELVPSI